MTYTPFETFVESPQAAPPSRRDLPLSRDRIGCSSGRGGDGLVADRPDESGRCDDRGGGPGRHRHLPDPAWAADRRALGREARFRSQPAAGCARRIARPDPNSENLQQWACAANWSRSVKPELLVLVGICTYLGCIPLFELQPDPTNPAPDWPGGFFCPCHGSKHDLAGRVFHRVQAPYNLPVSPYHFPDEKTAAGRREPTRPEFRTSTRFCRFEAVGKHFELRNQRSRCLESYLTCEATSRFSNKVVVPQVACPLT